MHSLCFATGAAYFTYVFSKAFQGKHLQSYFTDEEAETQRD